MTMILKAKLWGVSFFSLCLLVGCGDDKTPSSQTTAPPVATPSDSESCVHKAPEDAPHKETKFAPRSPIESYSRQVSSGSRRKHLSGMDVRQEKAPLPQTENSDVCKARVAARYQECLRSVQGTDPASKRRCDVFKSWFRDRCQSSSGGTATSGSSDNQHPEGSDSSEKKPNK